MKLLATFLRDLKVSYRSFYIYIEFIMALIIVAVLLFVVPENFDGQGKLYLYLDPVLSNKPSKVHPDPFYVEHLARRLSEKEVKYYTCHCTGRKMYAKLQETLKKDIDYVRTGRVVEI